MGNRATSILIASALLLAGCGNAEGDEPEPVAGSTTSSVTTASPSTSSISDDEPTTTTAATSPQVPDASQSPGEPEVFDIPPGFFMESFVVGEQLVMFGSAGKGGGGVFLTPGQPLESATNIFDLADPNLDPGSINQMVFFQGRYYGFPIWAEAEDDESPAMYTSDDGIAWRKTAFGSVTKQASLRFTPDEPATVGGAGVAVAIVSGDQIVATGWVTEEGVTVPVLWKGDGETWAQSYLPSVEGATQGGSVATSTLGTILTLEGGSYYGFGTYVQTPGADWALIATAFESDGNDYFTRGVGASDTSFYHLEFSHQSQYRLSTSSDGIEWAELQLPATEMESIGMYVTSEDELILYDQRWILDGESAPTVTIQTSDGWVSTTYEGTRIVHVDDDYVVTADDDHLYRYVRS